MNIIILGPPASGKGTQAKLIAEKFAMQHISTGDLLREEAAKGTPQGQKIKKTMEEGKLILFELVMKLVKKKIQESEHDIIFDGFPRNLDQAEKLDEITQIDLVLSIKVSDDVVVKRVTSRRTCQKCGAIFGDKVPPKKPGVCDLCGGKLFQRDDEQPEVVKKRLEVYRDQTEPLLEYYKPRNLVQEVDGTKSVEEVFKDICEIIAKAA